MNIIHRHVSLSLVAGVSAAAFALSAFATFAQDSTPDSPDAAAQACYDVGGRPDDAGECHFTSSVQMDIHMPLAFSAQPVVYNTLMTFIDEQRASFVQQYAQDTSGETGFAFGGSYELDMEYETIVREDGWMNVLYSVYTYTGGAHGLGVTRTFLFDPAAERQLALADLFSDVQAALDVIAPLAAEQVTIQLGADFADATWVAEGTDPTLENYQSFILNDDAITFIFSPYQVAAYAAGEQRVTIPLETLRPYLAEDIE